LGKELQGNVMTNFISLSIKIGHDNLDADALTENVSKIANWLTHKFPGGWRNVRQLSVSNGMDKIPPLIVYFSTGKILMETFYA
jgi:ribosomal protein L1